MLLTLLSFVEGRLYYVTFVLYLQAVMLALSNFNNYSRSQSLNFEGLNTLSTVFSIIFCVFNTLLGNLIVTDFAKKIVATVVVYFLVFASIFMTSFNFDNMQ